MRTVCSDAECDVPPAVLDMWQQKDQKRLNKKEQARKVQEEEERKERERVEYCRLEKERLEHCRLEEARARFYDEQNRVSEKIQDAKEAREDAQQSQGEELMGEWPTTYKAHQYESKAGSSEDDNE